MNLNSELTNSEAKIGSLLSQLSTQIEGLGNVVNYGQFTKTTAGFKRLVQFLNKYMNHEKDVKKRYQSRIDDQDKEISKLNTKISDYYTQTEYEKDVGIPVGSNDKVKPRKRNMNNLSKEFTDPEVDERRSASASASSSSSMYKARLARYLNDEHIVGANNSTSEDTNNADNADDTGNTDDTDNTGDGFTPVSSDRPEESAQPDPFGINANQQDDTSNDDSANDNPASNSGNEENTDDSNDNDNDDYGDGNNNNSNGNGFYNIPSDDRTGDKVRKKILKDTRYNTDSDE